MARTVQLTENAMKQLHKDYWTFSSFIDDSMLDFKHNRYTQASYYFPGGYLTLSKSNNTITADWRKE